MGNDTGLRPTAGTGEVAPLPGEGTGYPQFDRWAAEQEQAEWLASGLRGARGAGERVDQQLKLAATGVACQARSPQELIVAVRHVLLGSHLIRDEKDADTFIGTAVYSYRDLHADVDPDWALVMSLSLYREYEQWQTARRRRRVGDIARQIQSDTVLQARLEFQDEVERLSAESGLDPGFVEEFLLAYAEQTRSRLPAGMVIDLRRYPVLTAPMLSLLPLITIIRDTLPGMGTIEAIYGKDLLTGRELEDWERVLAVATDIVPLVAGAVLRPVARIAGIAARSIIRASARALRVVPQLVRTAVQLRIPAVVMLRFTGRMARLSLDGMRALLNRVRTALRSKGRLYLTPGERQLIKEITEAFREFPSTGISSAIKSPTIRGFRFLNRSQPQVLGRILGRLLNRSAEQVPAGLQSAEAVASDLVRRIRLHWDAAVTGKRETADRAARRVFDELKRQNPEKPNEWVRGHLYDLWRKRALRRVHRDSMLRRELQERAGIIVGYNPKTDTYSLHIRTTAPRGTPFDFDHAVIGHEEAVQRALATGDYRHLVSTVDSSNLQLLTARENRSFIEALRDAGRGMSED